MTTVQPRAVPGAVTTFQVASPDLEAVVRDLAGLRLADMFASGREQATLRLVWANDTAGQAGYVITETPIEDGEYPALSDIAPAAFVEECEIYEQFGIRPATGKPLNRMMLPPHADLPTLGRKPARSQKRSMPRTPWAGRRLSSRSARSGRSGSSPSTTAWSPAVRKSSTCTCSPGTSTAAWNGGCRARPRNKRCFSPSGQKGSAPSR